MDAEAVAVVALARMLEVVVHCDSSKDVGQRNVPCAALVCGGANGGVGGLVTYYVVSHQHCPNLWVDEACVVLSVVHVQDDRLFVHGGQGSWHHGRLANEHGHGAPCRDVWGVGVRDIRWAKVGASSSASRASCSGPHPSASACWSRAKAD